MKKYFAILIAFTVITCPNLSAMVGAGVTLQAADTEAGRAQQEVLDYNFRYGHDIRLLLRAYTSLIAKYPGILGLTCLRNAPAGTITLDKFKNPGYMSTPGSSEYCTIYLINQERSAGAQPGVGGAQR